MATLNELAQAVASLLADSTGPEPLPVECWNETPTQATCLVKNVIVEAAKAGLKPALVRIDPNMAEDMGLDQGKRFEFDGVPVELEASLMRRIEFYRVTPAA